MKHEEESLLQDYFTQKNKLFRNFVRTSHKSRKEKEKKKPEILKYSYFTGRFFSLVSRIKAQRAQLHQKKTLDKDIFAV